MASDPNCDPFEYLYQALVPSFNIDAYVGGGRIYEVEANEDEGSPQRRMYMGHKLFVEMDGEYLGLMADYKQGGYEGSFWLSDSGALYDVRGFESDAETGINFYYETLAIAYREDIASFPAALVNEKYVYTYDYLWDGYGDHWTEASYEPFVVFHDKMKFGDDLTEIGRIYINSDNNDYYESFFQYDINNDGILPIDAPRIYATYSEDTISINGRTKYGSTDSNWLTGKKRNDLLDGKEGDDVLIGRKGRDLLYGSEGFDELYGSYGKDFLDGGDGDDTLAGGSGSDVFKLSKGNDQIIDFSSYWGEQDKVAIPTAYIDDFIVEESGENILVIVPDYGTIELLGMSLNEIAVNNIFLEYI